MTIEAIPSRRSVNSLSRHMAIGCGVVVTVCSKTRQGYLVRKDQGSYPLRRFGCAVQQSAKHANANVKFEFIKRSRRQFYVAAT